MKLFLVLTTLLSLSSFAGDRCTVKTNWGDKTVGILLEEEGVFEVVSISEMKQFAEDLHDYKEKTGYQIIINKQFGDIEIVRPGMRGIDTGNTAGRIFKNLLLGEFGWYYRYKVNCEQEESESDNW